MLKLPSAVRQRCKTTEGREMHNLFSRKNAGFYSISGIYLLYPLLYIFKDCYGCGYRIINNYDFILNVLWITIGIFASLTILHSFWLRKYQNNTTRGTIQRVFLALLLFSLFYPYVMAVTLLDFALFGWR